MRDDCKTAAPMGLNHANFESAAKREKTWDECGIEERLERLRQQQRGTVRIQQDVIRNLRERVDMLERHQHNSLGEVLVSVHAGRHGSMDMDSGQRDPLA